MRIDSSNLLLCTRSVNVGAPWHPRCRFELPLNVEQDSQLRFHWSAGQMANPDHERALRQFAAHGDNTGDMSGFDLSGVSFPSIRLRGVNLTGANLRGAKLSGGQFCDCDFRNAILKQARMVLGDFRAANFSGADLSASDLNGSVMTGVNLTDANLSRANLVKTRLNGANLTGANLNQTDLRGAQDITAEQLAAAVNSDKAILDERMLARLGRTGDLTLARHGRRARTSRDRNQADLVFESVKPCLGDLFLLCGWEHPLLKPTGKFRFNELADFHFEQVDDYFAICVDGDPVVWLFPMIGGCVVQHHSGPFDALRIELGDHSHKKLWTNCAARFKEILQ